MESNYYTPTIEEFYVGFECEIKNSSDEPLDWEQLRIIGVDDAEISINGSSWSLMDWSFYDSKNAIRDEFVRVKYLDKEDIESLGWANTSSNFYTLNKYHMATHVDFNTHQIRIWTHEANVGYSDIIFDGTIKNKSELKVLMKQLGIDGNTK
jgi:hypothetical protein